MPFDDERLAGGLPANRYEVRAGGEFRLSRRWSARGYFKLQRGDAGYNEVVGRLVHTSPSTVTAVTCLPPPEEIVAARPEPSMLDTIET